MSAYVKPPAALTASLMAAKGAAGPAAHVSLPGGLKRKKLAGTAAPLHRADLPQSWSRPAETAAAAPAPAIARPALDPQGRARVSLRLDPERHLRLKLASAHLGCSIQELLTGALDRYLEVRAPDIAHGSCACLAAPKTREA